MKLEKRFLLIAILAIALAIPVALAMQHRTHQLKIEKSQNNNLHIQLDKSQKDLQLKSTQLEQVQQQKLDEQKKNEDLQKQLQSKRSSKPTVAEAPAQTAPVAVIGNCEQYRGILSQYNWNVETALQVMNAESTCNSGADNPHDGHPTCYGSRGLFGIGCDSTGNYAGMFDASANIAQAYSLYASRGWQPWGATTCAVKVSCL